MISPEALEKARSLVANYGSDPDGLLVGAIAAALQAERDAAAPKLPDDLAGLVERLEKRAKEDDECADNSRTVADLLSPELARFNERDPAGWNTYAVRMAVDHRNSMERDRRYSADLRAALTAIQSLVARNAELEAGLERALSAVEYQPGDHPIVPMKHDKFVKAIRSLLNKDRQP